MTLLKSQNITSFWTLAPRTLGPMIPGVPCSPRSPYKKIEIKLFRPALQTLCPNAFFRLLPLGQLVP